MNYELAKELKDAGFPQEGDGYGPYLKADGEIATGLKESWGAEVVYCPILHELIEACGEDIAGLDQEIRYNDGQLLHKVWWARPTEKGQLPQLGSTPEEAVARLWLALKGKSPSSDLSS